MAEEGLNMDVITEKWNNDSHLLEINSTWLEHFNSSGNFQCQKRQILIEYFLHYSIGPAALIIGILALLQSRRNLCLKCLDGRPGTVVPLNMLDDYNNRWSYAFAFGAIANMILGLLTYGGDGYTVEDEGQEGDDLWSGVLSSYSVAFEICFIYFPFFGCLGAFHQLAGSVFGFLYTAYWFCIRLVHIWECINPVPQYLKNVTLWSQCPTLICLAFLVVKFFCNALRCFRSGKHFKDEEPLAVDYHNKYVNDLFKPPPKQPQEKLSKTNWYRKLEYVIHKYIYENRPHFMYSTRIITTMLIILIISYQILVLSLVYNAVVHESLKSAVDFVMDSDIIDGLNATTLKKNLEVSITMVQVSWYVVASLSFIFFTYSISGILTNYRENLLMLYRGDRSFIPDSYRPHMSELVSNAMKYGGYQIAYILWGLLLFNVTFLAAALLFCFVIILPLMNNVTDIIEWIGQILLIPLGISLMIFYLQWLLTDKAFIQDKVKEEDPDKPLALTNRRWFHVADYFLFVAHVTTGFFSSLSRIFKSMGLGLFFIGRVDKCVMMKGLESFDNGNTAYIGMLAVEHAHGNPVLRVFCSLLLESRDKQPPAKYQDKVTSLPDKNQVDTELQGVDTPKGSANVLSVSIRRRRALCRWNLALTLLRNPDLRQYRKHATPQDKEAIKFTPGTGCLPGVARKSLIDHILEDVKTEVKLFRSGTIEDMDEATLESKPTEDEIDSVVDKNPSFRNISKSASHSVQIPSPQGLRVDDDKDFIVVAKESKQLAPEKIMYDSFHHTLGTISSEIVNQEQMQQTNCTIPADLLSNASEINTPRNSSSEERSYLNSSQL